MTATIMDPVTEGRPYTVRFKNKVSSTGVVLVVLGWVPKQQQPVPAPQQMVIAPGAAGELTGTVPAFANARRMIIVAALDADEAGRLELLEATSSIASESIAETTTWEMLVEADS